MKKKKVRATLKIYEIHSRMPALSRTLLFDNFVKATVIFVIDFHKTGVRNSLDNNLLNINIKKKLLKQCTLCSTASIIRADDTGGGGGKGGPCPPHIFAK